jgi:hypothetical protein
MLFSLSWYFLWALESHATLFEDDGLSLLQMKTSYKGADDGTDGRFAMTANASRARGPAGDRERELCPHEIEDIQQETTTFGCRGLLQAPATRMCNLWGDPHVSRTFPMTDDMNKVSRAKIWDTLWQPGLFRMASASDGSWEVQLFNCGTWAAAVAVRFKKQIVEFVSEGTNMRVFLNGRKLGDEVEWPIEIGNMFIDNSHRKSATYHTRSGLNYHKNQVAKRGGCVDDPGGQVYVDVSKIGVSHLTFSVKVEAAEGSFTTQDTDSYSLCNVDLASTIGKREGSFGQMRYHNWEVDMVAPEDSLFIGSGSAPCDHCRKQGWAGSNFLFDNRNKNAAEAFCGSVDDVPKQHDDFHVDDLCKTHNIAVERAQAACVHLKDDGQFYEDCQLDFCGSDGNQEAAEEAEDEELAENPQPVCAVPDETCDPANFCCSALKDQAILNFGSVVTNNICGDGDGAQELRFGSALTQDGQAMDLVVQPVDHVCGRATNDRNGMKSELLATLAVQAGREGTFDFKFVAAGTDTPATPKSVVFSFLDLDQGKKGKQQESVEVCGAVNAVVSDSTELEQSSNGNCLKFTSSTWGNAKDNPNSPDTMSDVQRARAVAYQISGSSFRATLGATGKGSNPRKFLFAGHPSIACK